MLRAEDVRAGLPVWVMDRDWERWGEVIEDGWGKVYSPELERAYVHFVEEPLSAAASAVPVGGRMGPSFGPSGYWEKLSNLRIREPPV